GDKILVRRGMVSRYRGAIPRLGPLALVSLAQGMARLEWMARRVPPDAPWAAKRATAWDRRSAGDWTKRNVPNAYARDLLKAAVRGLFTADPADVSLLDVLQLIRSAGGLNELLSIDGGYQQDMFAGGAQAVADQIATEPG